MTVRSGDRVGGGSGTAKLGGPSAGAITTTPTKTAPYTAGKNELVPVDATAGPITITLPSAATAGIGGVVIVRKADTTTNAVSVARAGTDTINGSSTSSTVSLAHEALTYTSDGTSNWTISSGQKSLSSLDTRYAPETAVALPAATGTDDTTALNSALAAGAGKVLRGRPGQAYQISAPLVVYSGTTLDMTGCTVTLKTGSNCNLLNNRAVGQVRRITDAAMTASSATLTSATAAFVSGDVGKTVVVHGAGVAGALLSTTISAVTNATTATLAVAASTTVVGTYAAVGPRDSNITVLGGTWVRTTGNNAGTSGWDKHNLRFRHVDGLVLRGLTIRTAEGKYAVNVADVTDTEVRDLTLAAFSDGVHVQGPAARTFIAQVRGTTGDDSVAITPRDWPAYDDAFGNVEDTLIQDVATTSTAANLVKVLGGCGSSGSTTPTAVRRTIVQRVAGTATQSAFTAGDDTAQSNTTGGTVDDLVVTEVRASVPAAQNLIKLAGRAMSRVRLAGIEFSNAAASVPVILYAPGVAATLDSLTVDRVRIGAGGGGPMLRVDVNGTVSRLQVAGVDVGSTTTGYNIVHVRAVVTDLVLSGVTASMVGSSNVVALGDGDTGAQITRGSISGVHLVGTGGSVLRAVTSGHTLPRLEIVDVETSGVGWIGDLATTTELHLTNVTTLSPGSGIMNVRATAAITIRGAGLNIAAGGSNLNIAAGGTVTSKALAFEVDVSKLTLTAGSLATNTNSSLTVGTGPVVCNGSTWRSLANGSSVEWYPAATDAAIRAAVTAAVAAGGGRIMLPAGTITLSSPLPVTDGIWYVGVEPQLQQIVTTAGTWLADGVPNFVGGTVLVGNGTFAAFEANATDQGSVASNIGTTEVNNAGILNVAIDNVTYGIHVGASNIMGMVWGRIDKVYIRNASAWGVKLVNFAHVDIGEIRTWLCQNGQHFGADMPAATFIPGNSTIRELYNLTPNDGRDNRLCRGIVFEAMGTGGALNELSVGRVQNNGFNRTLLSVSAGFTSGSTSVTVPDGTKFAVGMPLRFTSTGNGVTASYIYSVLSVTGNTITVGAARSGAAITATGTGNLTLETYGYSNVALIGTVSGSKINNSSFGQVDSEGVTTVGLYLENVNGSVINLADIAQTALVHICARSVGYTEIHSANSSTTDFDAASTGIRYYGARSTTIQRPAKGFWRDDSIGTDVFALGGGSPGQTGGDLQVRVNGFAYPAAGMGERVFPRDSTIGLTGSNVGNVVYAGSSAATFTLPTIVTDTSVANSHIGLWFRVSNVGTGTVTVATDGTQLINKAAGKTSVTVAPGQAVKVTAVKDNSGNLFWSAPEIYGVSATPGTTDGALPVADSSQPYGYRWSTLSPDIQVFTVSGTWTKPTGAKAVRIGLVGGGGGGGSGRRGAAATVRGGGGGGSGASLTDLEMPASSLPATVTVTVGAAGSAGATQTGNDGNGIAGGSGGVTTFGSYARAANGGGGGPGTVTGGNAGSNQLIGTANGSNGGAGGTGVVGANSGNSGGPGGGGGGGGISAADAAFGGGAGGPSMSGVQAGGGTVGGASPTAGVSQSVSAMPGGGGGGGAASLTAVGQDGAVGGTYGAGGGGGGASVNGFNSGAGGLGAGGVAVIITYF